MHARRLVGLAITATFITLTAGSCSSSNGVPQVQDDGGSNLCAHCGAQACCNGICT
jgi:hypothetical protein